VGHGEPCNPGSDMWHRLAGVRLRSRACKRVEADGGRGRAGEILRGPAEGWMRRPVSPLK